ncbi:aprataxin-like protein isoform X3 [Aedes aegypti]|uniref:Uncharacterized protein n=1 Tax=Aedes aegypti TaxID=7159 RepID=A0A6I8TGH7_AEDAE|nr:aprataxin-like protein isoform X3 [Aedes aegypti]
MTGKAGWSYALIRDINSPANHIIRSELAVVIRDKYPKARHHFLVLPWANIDNVYEFSSLLQLIPVHIPLLKEMFQLAKQAIELNRCHQKEFAMGFHMRPSMHRLHLHVISKDFVSARLKTVKHWNIFRTDLFMPFESVLLELQERGHIKHRPEAYINSLMDARLECNQCDRQFDTLPALKEHLLDHLNSAGGEPFEVLHNGFME